MSSAKLYTLGKVYVVTYLPKFAFFSSILLLSYQSFMWWERESVAAKYVGSFPVSMRFMLIS